MSHIVESCPLTKLNDGLSRLHSADEDAVSWLTHYAHETHMRRRQPTDEFSYPRPADIFPYARPADLAPYMSFDKTLRNSTNCGSVYCKWVLCS